MPCSAWGISGYVFVLFGVTLLPPSFNFIVLTSAARRFQSLSEGSSSAASFWGSAEHEANNYLEEVTHQLHQRQQLSPEHLLLAQQAAGKGNPTRKPSVDNWIVERPSRPRADAAAIQESLSPDDSLVVDHDSLKAGDDQPTIAMDSLQCPTQQPPVPPPPPALDFQQPDSLSYEEDTFVKNNGDFFDSMEAASENDNAPARTAAATQRKKLIIPYATDSYSSNKSLSTSQDDDDDDDDEEDEEEEEEEEDVDEVSSVVKDVPIAAVMSSKRPVSASPALLGPPASSGGHRLLPNPHNLRRLSSGSNPDLRHGLCPNLNGPFPAKRLPADPALAAAAASPPVVSPQHQSLMRLATERMKRKFLGGWN